MPKTQPFHVNDMGGIVCDMGPYGLDTHAIDAGAHVIDVEPLDEMHESGT